MLKESDDPTNPDILIVHNLVWRSESKLDVNINYYYVTRLRANFCRLSLVMSTNAIIILI